MEEKVLFSNNDEFLISQVCTLLEENNIPYVRKDMGAGDYMNVALGQNTTYEKKILVNLEDYDKAKNLIEYFNNENVLEEDIPEELKDYVEEDDENTNLEKNYGLPMKIAMTVLILMFIGLIVTIIIKMR